MYVCMYVCTCIYITRTILVLNLTLIFVLIVKAVFIAFWLVTLLAQLKFEAQKLT